MNASADSFESSKRSITNSPVLVRCAESRAHNLSANEGGTPKACNLFSHCERREILCLVMRFSSTARDDRAFARVKILAEPEMKLTSGAEPNNLSFRRGRVSSGLLTNSNFVQLRPGLQDKPAITEPTITASLNLYGLFSRGLLLEASLHFSAFRKNRLIEVKLVRQQRD
jgi:hypothetical protein